MTPPTDAYVPVEMRWRLVRAGDVVLDPNGTPWMVTERADGPPAGPPYLVLRRGRQDVRSLRDPDQTVRVLVPWPEAAGIVLLREGLGPVRVLDRGEVA